MRELKSFHRLAFDFIASPVDNTPLSCRLVWPSCVDSVMANPIGRHFGFLLLWCMVFIIGGYFFLSYGNYKSVYIPVSRVWNFSMEELMSLPKCAVWNTSTEISAHHICTSPSTVSPLLVMFTTMADSKNRRSIYGTTFKLWSQHGIEVKPVLFVSVPIKERFLLDEACSHGWDVYVAPSCRQFMLPVLPDMFRSVRILYPNASFYGYANGDMEFGSNLLPTFQALDKMRPGLHAPILAIGRRTDITVSFCVWIDLIIW